MAADITKKNLKRNDRNPFEKSVKKKNPFEIPDKRNDSVQIPKLKKKVINDLMTARVNKDKHSELKSYAVKNNYLLKDLYEVAISEFLERSDQIIKEYKGESTTIKVSKNVYLKLRDIKYETHNSQSDIFSSAIESYLKDI